MAIAEQEAASYGLPSAVVNEVLLAQSYVQLLTYPLWLLFCYSARVKFGNSNHVASKTVTTYCGALYILDVIHLAQGKAKRCSVDRIHARTRGEALLLNTCLVSASFDNVSSASFLSAP